MIQSTDRRTLGKGAAGVIVSYLVLKNIYTKVQIYKNNKKIKRKRQELEERRTRLEER